ncbi:MAG: hypothetical protein QOD02_5805 [Mycobacterium sp.]|jgi:hypothetical protein|nr:hypothetical protein [Mycobacterium sp.]MDT7739011.1 hypothetical protein [Mycobacterium sp.]
MRDDDAGVAGVEERRQMTPDDDDDDDAGVARIEEWRQ